MTRRILLTVTALALFGGAGQALANDLLSGSDGRHEVCVGTRPDPSSPSEGLCVWVPTK